MSISNNKMPDWVEEFVAAFSKTASNKEISNDEELTVEADININDLDEIIWNDEKYHVMFDESGANIINEFGNTVTTLENVKTLDEVNKRLSEKQIVTSSINNELEQEINKVAKYMENENNIVKDTDRKKTSSIEITAALKKFESKANKILNEKIADFGEQISDQVNDQVHDSMQQFNDNIDDKISSIINQKLDYIVDEILNRVSQGINQLITSGYSNKSMNQIEQQQYDNSAKQTMNQINNENGADRTTPEGFYNSYEPNNDEDNSGLDVDIKNDEEDIIDKNNEEDLINEDNELKNKSTDSFNKPIDLRLKDKPNNIEKNDDSFEEDFNNNDEDEYKEDELHHNASEGENLSRFRKHKNSFEKSADSEDNLNPVTVEDLTPSGPSQQNNRQQDQNNQQQDEQLEEITGADAEIFKTAKCPFCSNKLNTESKDNDFLNISCGSCNTKYKVNLNDAKIFIR